MIKSGRLILCSCLFALSCSGGEPALQFVQEGDCYVVPEKAMRNYAERISEVDLETAAAMIDRGYEMADSISLSEGSNLTLLRFAGSMAEMLFSVKSELRSDELYRLVLKSELKCLSLQPADYRHIEWKRSLLECNAPGKTVPDIRTMDRSGHEAGLRSLTDKPTILFVHSGDCEECRRLSAQLAGSRKIRNAAKAGAVKLVTLFAADEDSPGLPEEVIPGWSALSDMDCSIKYCMSFDPRLIPSVYLLDADGVVILKASTNVWDVEDNLDTLTNDHC